MRTALVIACALAACAAARAQDRPELAWIDRMFAAGLTDPTGMTWIEVQTGDGARTTWRWGWLAPAVEGREDTRGERVVFLEAADWIPAPPAERRRVPAHSFEEVSRAMAAIDAPQPPRSIEVEESVAKRLALADTTAGAGWWAPLPIVARVAWLHRLGHTELAAQLARTADLTGRVGDPELARAGLPALLGLPLDQRALDQAFAAFVSGDDDLALRAVSRAGSYGSPMRFGHDQRLELQRELERRRVAGTFGVALPTQLPADVAARSVEHRVAWLIAQLENCSAWCHWRLLPFEDWRVHALAAIGDAAVAPLIEAIERDERLSRVAVTPFTMKAYDDPTPSLAPVRVVALAAAERIVGDIGVELMAWRPDSAKAAAAALRAYWAKHRGQPPLLRHYDVVRDVRARPAEWLAAARALAGVGEDWDLATDLPLAPPERGGVPNPATHAFTAPTAAEAILAALDRHVALRAEDDDIEGYLDALYRLNDARVQPELVRRAGDAKIPTLHRIAIAHRLHHLCVREPLAQLVAQLAAGTFVLSRDQLAELVRVLAATGTPEGEAAVRSFARPDHPGYLPTLESLLDAEPDSEDRRLTGHSYCLEVLRSALADTADTGWSFRIGAFGNLFEECRGTERCQSLPPTPGNGVPLRARATVRRCDRAAMVASELVIGAPAYHPIFGDADERLAALRSFCERYTLDAVRIPTAFGQCRFLTRLRALDRPATALDVTAGRAVFHLDGTGKGPAKTVPLPAVGVLTADPCDTVYVVQAEIGADGTTWYGATRGSGWERLRADQVGDLEATDVGSGPHPVRLLHRSGPRRAQR